MRELADFLKKRVLGSGEEIQSKPENNPESKVEQESKKFTREELHRFGNYREAKGSLEVIITTTEDYLNKLKIVLKGKLELLHYKSGKNDAEINAETVAIDQLRLDIVTEQKQVSEYRQQLAVVIEELKKFE